MTAPIPVAPSRGTYNPVTNELTLVYESVDVMPPVPDGIESDLWYLGPRPSVTFKVTVPRPVEQPQTAVGGQRQPDGSVRWYRVTWNGTTWVNPIRVADADGNPL